MTAIREVHRDEAALRKARMLIGGKWVESASGEGLEVEDPAHRRPVAEVPRGGAEDVARAVKAAAEAFPAWSRTVPARARAASRADCRCTRGAGRGACAHDRARDRERAPHPGAPRGEDDGRHHPLLRRLGRGTQGRDDPLGRAGLELHATGAVRRGRRHHPVERAGAACRPQDRPRALRRQHARLEGSRGCAARGAAARRSVPGDACRPACLTC